MLAHATGGPTGKSRTSTRKGFVKVPIAGGMPSSTDVHESPQLERDGICTGQRDRVICCSRSPCPSGCPPSVPPIIEPQIMLRAGPGQVPLPQSLPGGVLAIFCVCPFRRCNENFLHGKVFGHLSLLSCHGRNFGFFFWNFNLVVCVGDWS